MSWLARGVFVGAVAALAVGCGSEGPAGHSPDFEVVTFDEHPDCPAAGSEIVVDGESEETICHGEEGPEGAAGEDGEDGFSPTIETEELAPGNAPGDCPEGGVEVTITSLDDAGEEVEESVTICAGGQPLPVAEITYCNTNFPSSIEQYTDELRTVYGHIEVPGYTGEQSGELPEDDYRGQVGYGDVSEAPSDDWTWEEADIDEDFDWEPNRDSFEAELGTDEPGSYAYLYRMSVDGGDNWTYCGLEGIVDLGDYDADEDAGLMEVAPAPEIIVGWDFDGADNAERLQPYTGVGEAMFSDGDDTDPMGTSQFIGTNDDQWWANNWLQDADFPEFDDVADDDEQHYRFEGEGFDGYSEVELHATFNRSGSGPATLQIAVEYDDGTLAFLDDPIAITSTSDFGVQVDVTPEEMVGDPGAGAEPVAYRVYGYNASHNGGTLRVMNPDFVGN